jgi:hypothetical protein
MYNQLVKKLKVCYHIRKSQPLVPNLSQINQTHSPKPYFLMIHFNIMLPSTTTFRLSKQNLSDPCTLHSHPLEYKVSSSSLAWRPVMGHSFPWISWQQDFYKVGLSNLCPNPTWRTKPPYSWPLETGWRSYTPRHWIPMLFAFYKTHELHWDYLYPSVTTWRQYKV